VFHEKLNAENVDINFAIVFCFESNLESLCGSNKRKIYYVKWVM